MNVASLKLCRELYVLSGWDEYDLAAGESLTWYMGHKDDSDFHIAPMYDLGYLVRKLPADRAVEYSLKYGWAAVHETNREVMREEADTPENAAAKLAIELFKMGVLTKEAAR